MRKRSQYQHNRDRLKTKVPTIIVMSIALVCILYFGNDVSDQIAEMFVPKAPVTDDIAPMAVTLDDVDASLAPAPAMTPKTGTIMNQAQKNAAQSILKILEVR